MDARPPGDVADLSLEEERAALQVGQEVNVYVVNPEDNNGNVVLSMKRAQEQMSWENVEKMIATEPNRPKTRSGLRLTAAIDSSPTTVETAVMPTGRAALLNAATIDSSAVRSWARPASLK